MPPPEGYRRKTTIDVRFRDIDLMNHVNNAVYFTYLEQARFAYLRELAGANPSLERPPGVIVAAARIEYRAPVYLEDRVDVWIRVAEIGRTSFKFEYEVRVASRDDALAAAGDTAMVIYDYAAHRPLRVPEPLIAAFEAWEGRPIPRKEKQKGVPPS